MILFPEVVNTVVFAAINHVFAFVEYAIVFVPLPTAIHIDPFHATPLPDNENILVPIPVHVIPSLEYASVFVPAPVAMVKEPGIVIKFCLSLLKATALDCVENILVLGIIAFVEVIVVQLIQSDE